MTNWIYDVSINFFPWILMLGVWYFLCNYKICIGFGCNELEASVFHFHIKRRTKSKPPDLPPV